jgi:predicted dehydrogenase
MTKDSSAIRIGIIGCGRGAQLHHLPALSRMPEFKVVAAADLDAQRLEKVAGRFGIALRCSDYRDLLDSADIEAVAVATPTASHCEIGLAALHAGKHLFMEKPLALSLEECGRLIGAAERAGAKAVVALNSRWHRLVLRARALIRSGALGDLKAVRSVYTHWHPGETAQLWHTQRALGGGVIINDGVHHFDLWRFLLDADVAEICADSKPSEHFDDDTCTVTARLNNGMLASALFSFSTSANSELEIFGEAGRLLISLYRFDGLEFCARTSYPGSIGTRLRAAVHTLRELPQALGTIRRGGDFGATYQALWKHFADCIRLDAQPGCTLADGRKALQIALATVASSQTRVPISLTP